MSRDPFRNYDAWLEAPYQRMMDQDAAMERVVEEAIANGDLPEDPSADEQIAYFEKWVQEQEPEEDPDRLRDEAMEREYEERQGWR